MRRNTSTEFKFTKRSKEEDPSSMFYQINEFISRTIFGILDDTDIPVGAEITVNIAIKAGGRKDHVDSKQGWKDVVTNYEEQEEGNDE